MNCLYRSAVLFAAVALAACGNNPTLIDRTQPNYTKKSDLLSGQWYVKQTVVGSPQIGGVTIGSGTELEKVRWEIHGDTLIGYRTYEPVAGLDPRVDAAASKLGKVVFQDGTPFKGSPVVGYRILAQFDRQRLYNPATGEQSNVLVEDMADRPWYEREFIRVDWSNNVINNFEFWNLAGASINSYVTAQDSNRGDDAFTEDRDSNGQLNYFDFTQRAIVDPPSVFYPGYGMIPFCLFNQTYDCESREIKIRTSVARVDEERVQDYEPLQYGDRLMTKFGFYRLDFMRAFEGQAYDKGYGFTDSGKRRYAIRHNMWKKAKDGADTIDVTRREVRPIAYYLSKDFPKELMPGARRVASEWNKVFRRTVAVPRGREVNDPAVPDVFFVCENPVPAGAPAACGKEGTYVRLGDVRRHHLPYIDQMVGGLLGFGPSSVDPETGEIVSATAHVYGPTLDSWAGNAMEALEVLNGTKTLEEVISGKNAEGYVFQNLKATDPRRPANGPWSSKQGLVSESTQPMTSWARPTGNFRGQLQSWKAQGSPPLRKQDRRAVVEQMLKNNPALDNELSNLPEIRNAVLASAPSRDFQKRLESDGALFRDYARKLAMGTDPFSMFEKDQHDTRRSLNPAHGCEFRLEYSNEDYFGLAKSKLATYNASLAKYQEKGAATCANTSKCTLDEAKILATGDVYVELRNDAFQSVQIHEVGHTLGLVHNFIGSADALNYFDNYWDLRKQTVGVLVGGKRVLPVTPANLVDAAQQNSAQIDGRMREFGYSSIMDYGVQMNAQIHGVGKYDEAAILFAYSGGFEPGWVEVFNQMRTDYQNPNVSIPTDVMNRSILVRGAQTEYPYIQATHYVDVSPLVTDKFHYTTLPFQFAERNLSFEEALEQGLTRMRSRSFRKWSEMETWYKRIDDEVKNFNLSSAGFSTADWETAKDIVGKVAQGGPVEVPYMYCSDYSQGANVLCNTWDQGADIFEMTSKWLEMFDQQYEWQNFRRGRYFYTPVTAANAKLRFVANVPNVYQQWLFNIYFLQAFYGFTAEQMDQFFGLGDPIWQNYFTMSVVDSTNKMMQQFSVPSAGYHGKKASGRWELLEGNKANLTKYPASEEQALFTRNQAKGFVDFVYVPRGPGRAMYTQYDTSGHDWYSRTNEAGHYWDTRVAMSVLVSSDTNFLGVDRGSDALRYSLPYYNTFDKELGPLFAAIWAEDRGFYAADLVKNANGEASVMLPTPVKGPNFITGFDYPLPAVRPADGAGLPLPMEKIEHTPTWSERFYAQLYSMAFFTANFNQEFASFNQIYKLGSGEGLTPSDNYSVVTFPDGNRPDITAALPSGFVQGYVFAALKQNGAVNDTSAVKVVRNANSAALGYFESLKPANNGVYQGNTTAQWESAVRESVRVLEMTRGLYDIFGRAF